MKNKEFKKLTRDQLFARLKKDQLSSLSRDELTKFCLDLQDINLQLLEDIDERKKNQLLIQESYLSVLLKIFKPSIRPEKKVIPKAEKIKKSPNRKHGTLRERYPNLEVKETHIENPLQYECPDCKVYLSDTGLKE